VLNALLIEDRATLYRTAHRFLPQLEFVGLGNAALLAQKLEQDAQSEAPFDQLSDLLKQLKIILLEVPPQAKWVP